MNFVQAISSGFRNYFNFSGRASRSEFWYFVLFVALVAGGVAQIADLLLFGDGLPVVRAITELALLVPGISVNVRRLHDIDRTGWWYLVVLTGIGAILLIVWACKKGTAGKNRFGEDPLAHA
jgi:uncharacterized membrane protein YhaH (DUF805 family)